MTRNSIKIVCDFLDTDICVSYNKLAMSTKNKTFLEQYGDLDECIVEIRNAFGGDGPFSMIDMRIINENGKNVFLSEFNPGKSDQIEKAHHTIGIDSDRSDSKEIVSPENKIHKKFICDVLNNLSRYLNKMIKRMKSTDLKQIELYCFLYKLNILPYKNIKKTCELYFMIKIRKYKKDGKNLEDSFLKKLKKFISMKKKNNFIAEIAPYLTTRELNYILTDYSDIQEEWFAGKSEKIALKYRTLYSKNKLKFDIEPEGRESTRPDKRPLEAYQSNYKPQIHEEHEIGDTNRPAESLDNLSDSTDEISISYIKDETKIEIDKCLIDEEKVVEVCASQNSKDIRDTRNFHLRDKDGVTEEIPTAAIKKNDDKEIITNFPVEKVPKSYLSRLSKIEKQEMNPFNLKPGWQDAIFSRQEVNRMIQEKLDKMLIDGDKKTSDDDFSDDKSEITLSESLTTLINTSRNRPFLLKVLSLCQNIYGNVKEKVIPETRSIESNHIEIIESLNLLEKQTNIKFLKMIQSNKNIIKYTRCLEYMNDTPIYAFVFDIAVVRGKLSSRQTTKGEKIYKFHPLPGKLHYAIFKQDNLFSISKFTSLEFIHVRKETEIVENTNEIILRNTQRHGQINFDIFHGNPSIEYGDDTIVLKGKDFKILVEISPTHWQSVYIPKE